MGEDVAVYDLGEVRLDDGKATPPFGAAPRRAATRERGPLPGTRRLRSGAPARAGLAGSLSLLLPGAGQIVSGEIAQGLFYLTTMGFAATAAWALLSTLDRLLPTLDVLGVPRLAAAAALAGAAAATVTLHVGSVVHAHALNDDGSKGAVHPVVAGVASALVPGWGQVLLGHRVRAAFFMSAAWIVGLGWLAVTPRGIASARELGLSIPAGARDGWGPAALIAAPILIWALAIYDAAAGASTARR